MSSTSCTVGERPRSPSLCFHAWLELPGFRGQLRAFESKAFLLPLLIQERGFGGGAPESYFHRVTAFELDRG